MDISAFNDIGNQIQALHAQGGVAALCGVAADPMQTASDVVSGAVPVVGVWATAVTKGHPFVVIGDGAYLETQGYTPDMLIAAISNAVHTVITLFI